MSLYPSPHSRVIRGEAGRVIIISGIDNGEHARVLVRLLAFAWLSNPFRLEEVKEGRSSGRWGRGPRLVDVPQSGVFQEGALKR